MQYCVVRVRLDAENNVPVGVEWGPLDRHPLAIVSDVEQDDVSTVMRMIRRGRPVWASFQTPFGMAPGRLLRIGFTESGAECLEFAPGEGRPYNWQEMARY